MVYYTIILPVNSALPRVKILKQQISYLELNKSWNKKL